MNKIYKRIISMIITFLMIVTMIPMSSISASAANKIDSKNICNVTINQSVVIKTDKNKKTQVSLWSNSFPRPEDVAQLGLSKLKYGVNIYEYENDKIGKRIGYTKADFFTTTASKKIGKKILL